MKIEIPPYGYDLVNGELVENEGELEVLKIVVKYRDWGYTLKAIAYELAEAGIACRAGKSYATQGIQRMLDKELTHNHTEFHSNVGRFYSDMVDASFVDK